MNNSPPCDGCEGITDATPLPIFNPPGRDTASYRIGTHAEFKAAMLAGLSSAEAGPLRALQTRENDDFTIALLDAWATSLDVLTFYQERLANEAFLRTATERRAIIEHARLIGYEPRPGIAAETVLAITLETTPGSPESVILDPGLKVQSIPAPGEQSVTFETSESLEMRPAWNSLRPPSFDPPERLNAGSNDFWVYGIATGLKPGDTLLVISSHYGPGEEAVTYHSLKRIRSVTPYPEGPSTRLITSDIFPSTPMEDFDCVSSPSGFFKGTNYIFGFKAKVAPFGHNAPQRPVAATTGNPVTTTDWAVDSPASLSSPILDFDGVYDFLQQSGYIIIQNERNITRNNVKKKEITYRFFETKSTTTKSIAQFGISARVTEAVLLDTWMDADTTFKNLRETIIYADSILLSEGRVLAYQVIYGNTVQLDRDFRDPHAASLTTFPSAFQPGRIWLVSGINSYGKNVSELATIERAESFLPGYGAFTRLIFTSDLVHVYDRNTVTFTPNVIRASHGETVGEILGSGDASQFLQRFMLRQPPLTYVGADTASGGRSTLRVQINGLAWQQTDSLTEASPTDRVYTLRNTDDGQSIVQFGDGKNGARPPSALNNIKAVYRRGSGAAGNVKAGQLSLLISRPAGVKAVSNMLPATGGVDPEPRDDARNNAPVTTLTLDRVVSLRDYEDFARAFAGIAKARAMEKPGGILLTVAGPEGSVFKNDEQTLRRLAAALRRLGPPNAGLEVAPFRPFLFELEVQVRCAPESDCSMILAAVRKALLARFGFSSREFGEAVYSSKVIRAAALVPGVVSVAIIRMHAEDTKWNAEKLLLIPPSNHDETTRQLLPSGLVFLIDEKLVITAA